MILKSAKNCIIYLFLTNRIQRSISHIKIQYFNISISNYICQRVVENLFALILIYD